MYDSDVDEMFDIAEARAALQQQRRDLQAECDANSKLQRRFDTISSQLRAAAMNTAPSAETISAGLDSAATSGSAGRSSDSNNNFEYNSGIMSQHDEFDSNMESQSGWQVDDSSLSSSSSISQVADGLDSKENI